MLTISESAAEVIKVVLAGGDDSGESSGESSGLRIAPVGDQSEGGGELQAAIASEPDSQDEVIEESGVRVFLEPTASSLLGDKTLDAERDANGEVGLTVRD